jgi:hypothetical protein
LFDESESVSWLFVWNGVFMTYSISLSQVYCFCLKALVKSLMLANWLTHFYEWMENYLDNSSLLVTRTRRSMSVCFSFIVWLIADCSTNDMQKLILGWVRLFQELRTKTIIAITIKKMKNFCFDIISDYFYTHNFVVILFYVCKQRKM